MTYDKYKYKSYNSIYPRLYRIEKAKLRKVLVKTAVIEHLGSTAVKGLGGKGIIDILIFVKEKQIVKCLQQLVEIGFEYKSEHIGDTKRKFFQKRIICRGKERRVHIHLTADKGFLNSFIGFRNYLRENKKARNEYARIKKQGSKLAKEDKLKYANHKLSFLKETIKKALKEKE